MSPKRSIPWKKIYKVFGALLAAAAVFFLLREIVRSWPTVAPYIKNANAAYIILSLVVYVPAFLLNGFCWAWIIHRMDAKVSLHEYLDMQLTTAFARYVPGGIWGMLGKAVMCRKRGVSAAATYLSIVSEYVFMVGSAVCFAVPLLPSLLHWQLPAWATAIGSIAVIVAGCVTASLLFRRLSGLILHKRGYEAAAALTLRDSLRVILMYVVNWTLTGLGLYVLANAFFPFPPSEGMRLVFAYPASWVAGFVSPAPNGIGVREWCLRLLISGSYADDAVLLISVIARLWTTIGEILTFGVFRLYTCIVCRDGGSSNAA